MRSFILSVSADKLLSPIRNAVLAHAGYAVIPAPTTESAMQILGSRKVAAMVIGNSIPPKDRKRLCSEGHKRGVPAVVLDQYQVGANPDHEAHLDPLDGPEAVLEAVAKLLLTAQQRSGDGRDKV